MSCATCNGSGTMPGFVRGTFPCPTCARPAAIAHSIAVLSSPAPVVSSKPAPKPPRERDETLVCPLCMKPIIVERAAGFVLPSRCGCDDESEGGAS